jgi:hypothetical protein
MIRCARPSARQLALGKTRASGYPGLSALPREHAL